MIMKLQVINIFDITVLQRANESCKNTQARINEQVHKEIKAIMTKGWNQWNLSKVF